LRAELKDHIERTQEQFPGYGIASGPAAGILINDKRIRRVQRQYRLYPIRWQSFKIATTDANHGRKVYPNLLAGLQLTGITGLGGRHHLYSNPDGLVYLPFCWTVTRAR
jgi:putative transposase